MSDYYKATITRKVGKTVYLTLTIIDPNCRLFPIQKESGFLMLVQYFSEYPNKFAPEEIRNNFSLMVDNDWAKSIKSKYVQSFDFISSHNFPWPKKIFKLSDEEYQAWWNNEANLAYAKYKLVVKDATIISELKEGDCWGFSVWELS